MDTACNFFHHMLNAFFKRDKGRMHRTDLSLRKHQHHVSAVREQPGRVIYGFDNASRSLFHRKTTCSIQEHMAFKLLFEHHEMEQSVKQLFIQINSPESVPPAEMIGDKQYWQAPVVKIALKIYLMEFSFSLPYRIEPEVRMDEEMVACPVYHSAILKKINRTMKNRN